MLLGCFEMSPPKRLAFAKFASNATQLQRHGLLCSHRRRNDTFDSCVAAGLMVCPKFNEAEFATIRLPELADRRAPWPRPLPPTDSLC